MIVVPLDQIRVHWRDHRSALWWLACLSRRPMQFETKFTALTDWEKAATYLILVAHAAPYFIVLFIVGGLLGWYHVHGDGLMVTILTPLTCGPLFIWLRRLHSIFKMPISYVLALALPCGVFGAILFDIGVSHIAVLVVGFGATVAFATTVLVAVDEDLTNNNLAVQATVAFATGVLVIVLTFRRGLATALIVGGVSVFILLAVGLRAFYYVIHPYFLWPRPRGRIYRYHPAAWDDLCSLPLLGLDRLLVAFAQEDYIGADAEIERLITLYPAQRGQALRARTRLIARQAGQAASLAKLEGIVANLPEGGKGYLSQTAKLRAWVNEIAAQQARLDMLERPFFREPLARGLMAEIENFQNRIAGFNEPLASEFRKSAEHWREIAGRQLREAQAVLTKQPTPQVFRAGDPVDRQQEAFVPRHGIVGQVEQQVMLATGCPGLVLYGRRRTGKSTILRNLEGFLPGTVKSVTVSMQDPEAFTSLTSFLRLLGAAVPLDNKVAKDLSEFYRLLTEANSQLQAKGRRLLFALDEYEQIDSKIAEGVFSEDLLRTVRESIQSHRNITWIFTGSHEITELTGAAWTSYLVSARTIPVPSFKLPETHMLLTEPLKYSRLWDKEDSARPRFQPGFWGQGGIERIHEEAAGWPHLVQLIAEAVVDLINDEETHVVTPSLFGRALQNCLVTGHNVLYELMVRECTIEGEWEYLSAFRRNAEQPPPQDDRVYRSLRRRELVVEENGLWRLRVPLMARWLRERG